MAEEKTEKPTAKKLSEAVRNGDLLQSKELTTALVVMAGVAALAITGPEYVGAIREMLREGLSISPSDIATFSPEKRFSHLLEWIVVPLGTILGVTFLAAIAGPAVLGSLGFRTSALGFKFNKLNPASGIKRIFGLGGLIELLKALAKILVLGSIGSWLMWDRIVEIRQMGKMGIVPALDEVGSVVRCIELGAEDYLPKPFDPVLLKARIGACLEKKVLRDQELVLRNELEQWNKTLEARVREQVSQLERLGRLKRFFSPQLAELIVSGDADDPLRTHRRELTVVYIDLRGFTAFAETAEPEEVMEILHEYHAAMGRLILEYEGTLEHFAGDGMMIFFNDPVPVANAAERAIRMTLAMRDKVKELSKRWRKLGYDLDFGVGIAQGYATIGAIGFEGRWEYGAIGSVPNLAARLCGEAKAGEILVAQRLLAGVEEFVDSESIGELALKGFHRPVSAHRILQLRV